jgi:hypothetical protein
MLPPSDVAAGAVAVTTALSAAGGDVTGLEQPITTVRRAAEAARRIPRPYHHRGGGRISFNRPTIA